MTGFMDLLINLPAFDQSSLILEPLKQNPPVLSAKRPVGSSIIFGPSCESDCQLPELELNDLIVFYNMGGYTSSAGTKFNGFNSFSVPTYLACSNSN